MVTLMRSTVVGTTVIREAIEIGLSACATPARDSPTKFTNTYTTPP